MKKWILCYVVMLMVGSISLWAADQSECMQQFRADVNGDCYVNLADFAELASQWLNCANPLDLSCSPFTFDKNLIAAYSFDEGQGAIVLDQSGNHNDGLANNDPTWIPGVRGSAMNFDGVDDFVALPFGADRQFPKGISIQAWIKTSETNSGGIVVSRNEWNYIALATGPLNQDNLDLQMPGFNLFNAQDDYKVINGPTAINDGMWHHLVGTFDNSMVTIYVDGMKYSTAATGAIHTSANFEIGRDNIKLWEQGRWFEGAIDEVRIYDRALSDLEVRVLYAKEAVSIGLLAHYKLDETSGPVKDQTGVFDGVNQGATPSVQGVNGTAYAFDGVNNVIDTLPQSNIPSVISVSMWVYPTKESGGMQIWGSVDNASGGKNGFVANYSSDAEAVIFAYVSGNIDRGEVVTPNYTVPLNKWSFLTFTVDNSSNVKIYVNSVLQGNGSFSASTTSHDRALMIGKSILSQDLAFKGKIDDMRIYNRVLEDIEIQFLYQNP
jgi:hypothetical protein